MVRFQYDKVKRSFSTNRHTIYNLTFPDVSFWETIVAFVLSIVLQLTVFSKDKMWPLQDSSFSHLPQTFIIPPARCSPLPLNPGGFDYNQQSTEVMTSQGRIKLCLILGTQPPCCETKSRWSSSHSPAEVSSSTDHLCMKSLQMILGPILQSCPDDAQQSRNELPKHSQQK